MDDPKTITDQPGVPPVTSPVLTRMQALKQEQDAKLQELEDQLSQLTAEERNHFFFHKNDQASVELVNLLSSRVDAIRDAGKRKAFFLAHPELEVRYSFINFVP
jgi:hypothetical protein